MIISPPLLYIFIILDNPERLFSVIFTNFCRFGNKVMTEWNEKLSIDLKEILNHGNGCKGYCDAENRIQIVSLTHSDALLWPLCA